METIDECWRRVATEFLGPDTAERLTALVQQQRTDPASEDFSARVAAAPADDPAPRE